MEITLAIADPHPVVRAGIRAFCAGLPDFRVVAECGEGHELIDLAGIFKPRYVVFDPCIPGIAGPELARRVKAASSGTRMIAHGAAREGSVIRELFGAGISGYMLKEDPARHLVDAVEQIEAGLLYMSPLLPFPADSGALPACAREVLSQREYEIFVRLAQGARPRDIAKDFHISPKTVDTHRASILRKLKVDGVAGLVRLAREQGSE